MSSQFLEKPHAPPNDARQVYSWYFDAQINYVDYYIRLYISYNAWYRAVTGETNDREALAKLKKRFVIWDDYVKGRTMSALKMYVDKIVIDTAKSPLAANLYWDGTVKGYDDWKGIIEFWYQVRCSLVHGSDVPRRYVWLAYESLEIFMNEIVRRMKRCFTDDDMHRLHELSNLALTEYAQTERFKQLKYRLHQKYIASPDIWQVDMQRAS